jgi:hypothetical protein
MNNEFTFKGCALFASVRTKEAAECKDWRLTKNGKKMRDIAAGLLESKNRRGYVIASSKEMRERYGELMGNQFATNDDKKFMWAIFRQGRSGRVDLWFAPICGDDVEGWEG